MRAQSIALVTATVLTFAGVACGQGIRGNFENPAIRGCNDARVVNFLSGWIQGEGFFPGGASFACKEVGVGASLEDIVYLRGEDWCGSGGCRLLVLAPSADHDSFIIIGHVDIVQLPVRVLGSKTHGRNDLSTVVAGGGILSAYDAKLSYDGESYPLNPSLAPKLPLGSARGTVLFSTATVLRPM